MAVLAVLSWRPPTVSSKPLRAMAVVAPSSVSARRCHRVGVSVAADLPAVWQSAGRYVEMTSLLSVMTYQLSCKMADVL